MTEDQMAILKRLADVLEWGGAENGIAADNAAIYASTIRAALASSDAQADGGKGEAVAEMIVRKKDVKLVAWSKSADLPEGKYRLYTAPQAECAPRDGLMDLRRIAHELRIYNPAADEYKGEHIHKVWAREIDGAIEQAERAK
jgi:hypothetical protein